jgi:hypothetical protein
MSLKAGSENPKPKLRESKIMPPKTRKPKIKIMSVNP